ncbi:MAG: chemotaxis protein CheW, partial [Candidatus Hodarchaeota archaeon]
MKIILKSKKFKKASRNQTEDNLLLFTLLDNIYALLSSSVVQILQTLPITPVANSVPYFVGSTTFRGEVVPVIDLQSFFYGGHLNLLTRLSEKQNNYIALVHTGKFVIFQVETVLGSMEKPEESHVTNLVNFANPEENSYFIKAFLSDKDQIIVLMDNHQILERVVRELEYSQNQFVAENQALLAPMKLPEASEEYNIDLRQRLSVPVPSTTDRGIQRTVKDIKKPTNTATLVSVQNLDILIPNDRIIEIFNVQSITVVPNAPKAVVGTINFRGKVISVIDLAEILVPSFTESKKLVRKQEDDVQTIILEAADQQVAIIVDEFHEIVEMIETDLRPAVSFSNEGNLSYYFQGAMLDRSGHIILVLDVNFLFQVISDLSMLDHEIAQVILFTNLTNEDILKKRDIKQASLDENALVLITLLENIYALKSSSVIEIMQTLTITPVANSVPYFVGSTTFRGEVVPVIDLQSFFYGGQLNLTTKRSKEQNNYITVEHTGRAIIFQVESVLGSISMPDESQKANLISLKITKDASLFPGAFLYNDQIVVQLNHQEILNRIVYELEQMQSQFVTENQALLAPMKLPEASEEYNIHLKQNISVQRSITEREEVVISSQNLKYKGTLVFVCDLDILVPNNYVSEIFDITSITKIPNTPKAVIGSTNYRGDVIPVLNLAEVLKPNSTPSSLPLNNEVLILEVGDQRIALLTDKILSIIEMDETSLRPILSSAEGDIPQHFLQGLTLTPSEQIILILNVDYLFQIADNPTILEQESDQLLYFKNPVQESIDRTYVLEQEGLLFEDGGHIFLLNSEHVIQVIERNSFLFKDYPHDAIKGAAIHTTIVPLIDFNTILREKKEKNLKSNKSVGILINEPNSNAEFVLLVDNIMNKIAINNCEIFQNQLGLTRNTLSPIISGFFSYQGALGMIMSPDSLYTKIRAVIQDTLSLKDIKEEFPSTLLPEEIKFLEEVKSKRKELELLLFYRHEGIRLDYFVFKLHQ